MFEEVEGVTRLFRENLFQGVKATSGSVWLVLGRTLVELVAKRVFSLATN